MTQTQNTANSTRNGLLAGACVVVVAGMVGMAYAAVPLYQLFCQVTGYAGTTKRADAAPGTVGKRQFTVRFDANVNRGLGWSFKPVQRKVSLKAGQQTLAYYEAQNNTSEQRTGTATFNVTPMEAGAYFNKIECFCFTEQTLQANQSISMPVAFYIDPDIEKDPNLKSLTTITLSYTFFPLKNGKTVSAATGGNTGKSVN